MSGIGSTLRRHWLEIAWGAFSIVNLWVIVLLLRWETIPFHLIWVSLTLLYGFRVWRPSTTALVLSIVMLSTGLALTWTVLRGNEQFDEVTEVPLMAAMFVAMAVHAHRRQRAVEAERRSAATVRRVLERQRGFVRDASHELRTPITVARGHAELLRGDALDERSAKDADVVLEELDRLSQLSERLLTLASADHPGFLTFRDVVVEDLVAETVVRWGPVAPRDWRIDVQVEGPVRADRDRLAAAIDALIENAVHATETGGRIEVTARAEGSILVLEVSDQGGGIDPSEIPEIFERFARSERERARGQRGTGLGLAIVKAIVEAHGGSVEASGALGRGATFRIRIPGFAGRAVPFEERPTRPATSELEVRS
jgi:signal transduction histidine kinase